MAGNMAAAGVLAGLARRELYRHGDAAAAAGAGHGRLCACRPATSRRLCAKHVPDAGHPARCRRLWPHVLRRHDADSLEAGDAGHRCARDWPLLRLLVGNRITTGEFLPTTMRAKELAYHPSHTVVDVDHRLVDLFLHQSFLLPVLKQLPDEAGADPAADRGDCPGHRISTSSHERRERVLIATLAVLSVTVPAAYAAGGIIFDWYLFPANWLAMTVVIAVGVRLIGRLRWQTLAWTTVAFLWMALAAIQWTRSLAASTQDYHYRADIGRYLGEISHGRGTLLLEPAGYIPYFSGQHTCDEVGLVSDRVTKYMLRDPHHADGAWWMRYVEAEKP